MADSVIRTFFNDEYKELLLYEAVENMITGIGEVKIEVMKSQISFGTERKFAWVWLLIRKMKNRPENYIILSFTLDEQIDNPRIVKPAAL